MNSFPNCSKRLVLQVAALSPSTYYYNRKRVLPKLKPGPKPKFNDKQVLSAVKDYLKNPLFFLEGYKKIHKRLVKQGITVAKERLRRIMSEANLLCHQIKRDCVNTNPHNGSITTNRPNELWGMDVKEFKTKMGKIYFMGVIDHFNSGIMGWHMNTKHKSAQVMQALRNAVQNEFGETFKNVCQNAGLSLRIDHGSEFDSKAFDKELLFLGIRKSSSYIRSPQCNGIIERFHKTLKEQLINIYVVEDLESAKTIMAEFIERYNNYWLIHRLGLMSPLEYRENNKPSGNNEPEGVRH